MLSDITWIGESGVLSGLTDDLVIVIPVALGIFATLYGVRLAIKYFKGIAK